MMKPFNLEKALAGKPVRLKNGKKAYVKYQLEDKYKNPYPLRGFVEGIKKDGVLEADEISWTVFGEEEYREEDIIGMWEEPESIIVNGHKITGFVTKDEWEDEGFYYIVDFGCPGCVGYGIFYKNSQPDVHAIENKLVFYKKEDAMKMAKALLDYKVEEKDD